MALHHKLCHVLGGAFDLPHAETHTIVLPHALAYNAPAAPEAAAHIAAALGAEDGAQGLYDLIGRLGGPRALKDIGMPEDGVDRAAAMAAESPYWNPRPIERERDPRVARPRLSRRQAGGVNAMRRILLRDACVVTMNPALGELPRGSVLIEGERIAAIAPDIEAGDAETIDARGFLVIPGLDQFAYAHVADGAARRRGQLDAA